MSFLFKKPKLPEIHQPPPPKPPEVLKAQDKIQAEEKVKEQEKEVEKLKEEEKKKIKKGRERRSTLLTSPQGILAPAQVERKTLLGQ